MVSSFGRVRLDMESKGRAFVRHDQPSPPGCRMHEYYKSIYAGPYVMSTLRTQVVTTNHARLMPFLVYRGRVAGELPIKRQSGSETDRGNCQVSRARGRAMDQRQSSSAMATKMFMVAAVLAASFGGASV